MASSMVTSPAMPEAVQYTASPIRESLVTSTSPIYPPMTMPHQPMQRPAQQLMFPSQGPSAGTALIYRTDYYKFPNSIELQPGDTCGLNPLYDSYKVRSFRGENQHVTLEARPSQAAQRRNKSTRRARTRSVSVISSDTFSDTEASSRDCRGHSRGRHSKRRDGRRGRPDRESRCRQVSGSDVRRYPDGEGRRDRYQDGRREIGAGGRDYSDDIPCMRRKSNKAGLCHEIYVHHFHCPDKTHRHMHGNPSDGKACGYGPRGGSIESDDDSYDRRPAGRYSSYYVKQRGTSSKKRPEDQLYRSYRKRVQSDLS